MALDVAKLDTYLSVKQVAEKFDVAPRIVRREAKAKNVPGGVEILGRYGFDPEEVLSWEPPEAGTRIASKRKDGRTRYQVYLNDEELANLKAILPEDAIKDPKVARAARKAKKAAEVGGTEEVETPDGESPFGDFGLGDE